MCRRQFLNVYSFPRSILTTSERDGAFHSANQAHHRVHDLRAAVYSFGEKKRKGGKNYTSAERLRARLSLRAARLAGIDHCHSPSWLRHGDFSTGKELGEDDSNKCVAPHLRSIVAGSSRVFRCFFEHEVLVYVFTAPTDTHAPAQTKPKATATTDT